MIWTTTNIQSVLAGHTLHNSPKFVNKFLSYPANRTTQTDRQTDRQADKRWVNYTLLDGDNWNYNHQIEYYLLTRIQISQLDLHEGNKRNKA